MQVQDLMHVLAKADPKAEVVTADLTIDDGYGPEYLKLVFVQGKSVQDKIVLCFEDPSNPR